MLSQVSPVIPSEELSRGGRGVHDLAGKVKPQFPFSEDFRTFSQPLSYPLCTPQQDSADPHTLHPQL